MSLAMALGGAAHAATFTVMNNGESGPDTLRQALIDANANPGPDTVEFDSSFDSPQTIDLTGGSGPLIIIDAVTINGPGPDLLTIEGGGQDRIFFIIDEPVGGMEVAVSGMKLTGGHTPPGQPDGGAILGVGVNLTLTDTLITGNAADGNPSADEGDGSGGGIAVFGESLIVYGSVISNNTAGQPGDGIHLTEASGGGVFASSADVEIYGSTISGNTVYNSLERFGGGGGVSVFGGSLKLEKSEVSGNTAGNTGNNIEALAFGGGILTLESGLHIQRSTISGNLAGNRGALSGSVLGVGGGVAQLDGTATIVNSTISGNVAGNAPGVSSGEFNSAAGGGLAVIGNAELHSTTIVDNFVSSTGNFTESVGGGLAGGPTGSAPVLLHNSIVAGNGANEGPDLHGPFSVSYSVVGNDSDADLTLGPMVIIGDDPQVGPLVDNGGPTETHAIPNTSPAYNAGDPLDCPLTDQRGVVRPQAGVCDIGAFELATPLGGLLEAFDGYVQAGTLQGSGPGKSAENGLKAMRNKIATVEALMAEGDTAGACDELASALLKTDGLTPPPDFLSGTAASSLAADIQQVQSNLGCD